MRVHKNIHRISGGYNATLKWKPKSELSRVSNSAQTQQLCISMDLYHGLIHAINGPLWQVVNGTQGGPLFPASWHLSIPPP